MMEQLDAPDAEMPLTLADIPDDLLRRVFHFVAPSRAGGPC
jgi:hypothetical protein